MLCKELPNGWRSRSTL